MKKYIIAIIIAVFIMGFIVGLKSNYDLSGIFAFSFSFPSVVYSLLIGFIGIVLSFIGIPFYICLLLWEIMSFGLVTSFFFLAFSYKGILFSIIFVLIFKLGYWFCLILNSFYAFKLIKNNFKYLIRRFHEYKNNSKLYFKKILIINGGIIICFLFINLLGVKLANIFWDYFGL